MSEIIYCGMDVHKETVVAAVLPAAAVEPTRVVTLRNEPRSLRRFFRGLEQQGQVRACYEASGSGYVLQRQLADWGIGCEVIAPSLTPQRPGDQRKHDKRDAVQLARMYRSGDLVTIRIPAQTEERVRDLVRCRQVMQREILKSRQYISWFLMRRGLVYREGTAWRTRKHERWLRGLLDSGTLQGPDAESFNTYLTLLDFKLQQRDNLDQQIEQLALSDAYAPAVGALRCLRGIDTLAAMVLVCEIGDFRRFQRPGQLMAYLGLVPREHSSGSRERKGAITKGGNAFCRHVLVQAAWHCRYRPHISRQLSDRQRGQPATVIAQAWKAQLRLYRKYRMLAYKKPHQVAIVAMARELVGFIWAVMQQVQNSTTTLAA
jgi:transposase